MERAVWPWEDESQMRLGGGPRKMTLHRFANIKLRKPWLVERMIITLKRMPIARGFSIAVPHKACIFANTRHLVVIRWSFRKISYRRAIGTIRFFSASLTANQYYATFPFQKKGFCVGRKRHRSQRCELGFPLKQVHFSPIKYFIQTTRLYFFFWQWRFLTKMVEPSPFFFKEVVVERDIFGSPHSMKRLACCEETSTLCVTEKWLRPLLNQTLVDWTDVYSGKRQNVLLVNL